MRLVYEQKSPVNPVSSPGPKIGSFCLVVEYQQGRHEWEFPFPTFSRYSFGNSLSGWVRKTLFYSHSQSQKLVIRFLHSFSQSQKLGIGLVISHSQSQMCKSHSHSCLCSNNAKLIRYIGLQYSGEPNLSLIIVFLIEN